MTAKNEVTKTSMLDHSIEPTPGPAGAETMKAIVQTEYGSSPDRVLRLAEIDRPVIGDHEVLVRVRAGERGPGYMAPDDRSAQAHADHGFRVPPA